MKKHNAKNLISQTKPNNDDGETQIILPTKLTQFVKGINTEEKYIYPNKAITQFHLNQNTIRFIFI